MSIFGFTLLDASGQPNLIIDSSQSQDLIWKLVNNQDQYLVATPFDSGKVDKNQYHFVFDFAPAALTEPPTVQGWDVSIDRDDRERIKSLYIALSGSKSLCIGPRSYHKTTLTCTRAIQEDSNNSKVTVRLTAGSQVTLGGNSILNKSFGPFDLTLVQANTPTLSVPPLAVDFVGRRTVLNDGQTSNSFTFALTNMTQADFTLKPMAEAESHTIFIVWFDAAPNEAREGYPWALARVQDLESENFDFAPPSDDWNIKRSVSGPEDLAVSPRWFITVVNPVVLKPQDPVLFTFKGLKTNLDPGVTRMYLRFANLADFLPGVLIGELEKTPLLYGSKHGQGLYVSAGTPEGKPAPNYDSGLYVQQFGDGAAAIFNGGNVGIGTGAEPPGLRFGCQPEYAWVQSHAGKPLVINPIPRNVGIGTAKPGSSLSVDGGVAIGKTYAQNTTTVAENNLAVEGRVGIGTTEPGSSLSVDGGVAIGKNYAQNTTTVAENNVAVEGKAGIGTTSPGSRLSVDGGVGIGKTYATSEITQNNLAVEGNVGIGTTDTKAAQLAVVTQSQNNDNNTAMFFAPKIGSNYSHIHYGSTGDWYIRSASSQGKVVIQDTRGSTLVGGTLSVGGNLTLTGGASMPPQLILGADSAHAWVVDQSQGSLRIYSQAGAKTNNTPQLVLSQNSLAVVTEIDYFAPGKNKWYRLMAGDKSAGWEWATLVPLSDIRLKEDVRPIHGALEKVKRLRGVFHHWSAAGLDYLTQPRVDAVSAGPGSTEEELQALRLAERQKAVAKLSGPQLGLVAQDVEAILPEVVYENEDGHKCIRYQQLVALLIEAIKEQDQTVKDHTQRIAQQQAAIDRLTRV